MAKLFPAELPTSTKSGGEISIFNKIKKSGQDFDWSIMHSYKVKNHVFKKWGEIDFLFILPNKGIVCLEVKDHKEIVFENRQWFFGRAKKKGENPFDQIKDNTESLLKEIRKTNPDLNVPWWSAVIFTKAKFNKGSLPNEINAWEFMDADSYSESEHSFFKFIENVIDQGREMLSKKENSEWVSSNDNKPIVYRDLEETLSGKCIFSISRQARAGDRETSLALATKDQFQVLNLLAQTPRLLVEGLAGTGKTLMATKIAEREAMKGKVLFLAYNKNFINELKLWQSLNSKNITVESIDKYFKNHVENTVETSDDYWDKTLPLQFSDQIDRNNLREFYDYLVIDEAQDILSKPYKLSALNKIVKGGLAEGTWSFFGDFNEQMIYGLSTKEELFDNLNKYCSDNRYIKWSLGKNSRNPIDIGNFAQTYGRIDTNYESFLREEHGKVLPVIYKQNNRLQKIKETIISLFNDGYQPNEIIMLSQYKLDKKLVNYLNSENVPIAEHKVLKASSSQETQFVRYSTISSFKGLERPVVILLDIEEFNKLGSLFYIGITRSTERLVMHITDKALKEVYDV